MHEIEGASGRLKSASIYPVSGRITKTQGLVYEAFLPGASLGGLCEIEINPDQPNGKILAEVIGFREKRVFLMPFEEAHGVHQKSVVRLREETQTVSISDAWLGRVVDARGNPIDDKGPLSDPMMPAQRRSLYNKPSDPLKRKMVEQPLDLGVRAINGLLTTGKGQRVGIMAGSGVGKSVLLGMMARNTNADVNVIALIGERGREVREFIERDLGEEGLRRSVVIVATSDTSPLLRVRGANLAMTVAEYFRDKSKDVMLLMDSVTRFCMAYREMGLALGEPPTSKGYTPSVFAALPKLLERAGTSESNGSITGLFTVLVEGDDFDEPIADATRSILDGHIVLSREIASRNHFPAIDILRSTSRVMSSIVEKSHLAYSGAFREWMALYAQASDLINIGAYAKGSNPKVDQAIALQDRINGYLRQAVDERSTLEDAFRGMEAIVRLGESLIAKR